MYFSCPTNAFLKLFKNSRLLVEPNGYLSAKQTLVTFLVQGLDFFIIWLYYFKTCVYANFEAIAVFYDEHSSIYNIVIFYVNFSYKNLNFLLCIWKKWPLGPVAIIIFKLVLKNEKFSNSSNCNGCFWNVDFCPY